MNTFLNYLIEANAGIILFLLVYRLLLKDETNFSFRRYYLLVSLAISIGFPLITISGSSPIPTVSQVLPAYWLPEVTVGNSPATTVAASSALSVWTVLQHVYLAGVLFFVLRLAFELYQLFRLSKKAKQQQGIIHVDSNIVAFSFFHFIFIGKAAPVSHDDTSKIIDHEKVHQRLGHSFDIFAMELIRILFWFNPFINGYKKELTSVHEFQADERAVQNKHDIQTYCNLLARVALKSADFTLANHFNNSLTLKRITMMNTTKKKLQWWKKAALIPLMAGFFFLVACQDQVMEEIKDASKTASITTAVPLEVRDRLAELQKKNPDRTFEVIRFDNVDSDKMKMLEERPMPPTYIEVIKPLDSNAKQTTFYVIMEKNEHTLELAEATKTTDEVFLIVEETATPVIGMEAYYKKIYDEIQYPAEAKAKGIEGRVFVELVIQKDGTVSDLKLLKGIGAGCDEEAVRAIRSAGLWNPAKQRGAPVKQRMVIPVSFSLGESSTLTKTSALITGGDEMTIEYQVWSEDQKSKVLIGKVESPNGQPVSGVNLVIAKTTSGTVTGADGSFKLILPSGSGEVVLSHVSYKTSKIEF